MIHADGDEVVLAYSAPSNISFRGERGTGVTWKEWREMNNVDRDDVIYEVLFTLVDIGVKEDE